MSADGPTLELVRCGSQHAELIAHWRDRAAADVFLDTSGEVSGGIFFLLTSYDGTQVGLLELASLPGAALVGSFALLIAEPFRRQGYASAALRLLPALAEQTLGTRRLQIGVFDDNTAARALYKKHGFTEVERLDYVTPQGPRPARLLTNMVPRRVGFVLS